MTKTITIDLETWTPSVLSNMTGGIHAGQMMVITSGRRTGKSIYMEMLKKRIYDTNLCNEIFLPMFSTKPKYKFSRAKWYEAVFDINKYTDVVQWCTEQFGPHPRNPDAWSRWNHKYEDRIYFRDSKDYEWFILRWS
jgi:hypothetical protein